MPLIINQQKKYASAICEPKKALEEPTVIWI